MPGESPPDPGASASSATGLGAGQGQGPLVGGQGFGQSGVQGGVGGEAWAQYMGMASQVPLPSSASISSPSSVGRPQNAQQTQHVQHRPNQNTVAAESARQLPLPTEGMSQQQMMQLIQSLMGQIENMSRRMEHMSQQQARFVPQTFGEQYGGFGW